MNNQPAPKDVAAYISSFPGATQVLLEQMRAAIRKEAPDAEECINYGIPTFKLNGNLVHYAGYKHHIGFYPGAAAMVDFAEECSGYKNAKGSVQFPISQPLPLKLVRKIVQYRVKQNLAKTAKKPTKKAVAAKTVAMSESGAVDQHVAQLSAETAACVNALRKIILGADKQIAERIKWNSPSCYYTGEMKAFDPKEYKQDIVMFNLHKNRLLLVFPSGAKIDDPSGLLQGDYKDGRRVITFKDLKEIKTAGKALVHIIKDWIRKVDR